jgi:hypothetical protein
MAEKVLDLKLKYKNKFIDNARYLRDFKSQFQIGSDKSIFWQILDRAFPDKYTLISKSGNFFNLHLRKDMLVKLIKDGKELSNDELKSANIIQDDKLKLESNTEGSVTFGGKWTIEFAFITPYMYKPSREETAIARQFAHWSPRSPESKFTNIFLIIALLVTFIGLYIGQKNYVPPVRIDFAERLQRIEQLATYVETDIPEVGPEQGTATEGDTEEDIGEEVAEAAAMSSADFQNMFGMELGSGGGAEGDFSNELLEVTQMEEIVAATVGGGSGGGSGPGPGQAGTGFGDLDTAGSGGFDLSTAGDGLGSLEGYEGIDLGSGSGFEEVDLASLGGDIGDFKTTKVTSTEHFASIKKRFGNLKVIKQSEIKIEDQTPEAKTELAAINQVVNAYKPQISKLYSVESMMMDMYGTIEFSIIINASGKVEAVDTSVTSGSYFTDSFLDKSRKIIEKWKFQVKSPVGYSFRMKFLKRQ